MSLVSDYRSSDSSDSDDAPRPDINTQNRPGKKRITTSAPKESWKEIVAREREELQQGQPGKSGRPGLSAALSALLPKPRNSPAPKFHKPPKNTPNTETKSATKEQKAPPPVQPGSDTDQSDKESDCDIGSVSFFTIGHHEEGGDVLKATEKETRGEDPPKKHEASPSNAKVLNLVYDHYSGYYYDSSSGAYYYYDYSTSQYLPIPAQTTDQNNGSPSSSTADQTDKIGPSVDSDMLKGLVGKRERELLNSVAIPDMQAISQAGQLSGSDHIAPTHGSTSNIRATQPPKEVYQHLQPSKKQKQRHNIMYLAFQAKANELKLQESYAANRKTKKETQQKYGPWICTLRQQIRLLVFVMHVDRKVNQGAGYRN
ncbi:hypothetical protein H4219_001848 [Mycoemilia scoparia]|uniref:OCRE domain-containing protein n=1 Tax=Mycoemilia scoparia TaxID=417184 RepID=A0A9W8A8E3_9FUNG|nr:hypothetical protein H4219_001848 [Mycoemilia scoparia]